MESFNGLAVVSDDLMVGAKMAVRRGNTLHVSPAMYSLLSTADESELQHLAENLKVLNLPGFGADEMIGRPLYTDF